MKRIELKGTSVTEFFHRFPDETACLAHVHRTKFENQPCPNCGKIGRWSPNKDRKDYRHSCRKAHFPLRHTIMYRSNYSLMAWFYAMLLFGNSTQGISAHLLRRHLGIGMKGAHRLSDRIRIQMALYDRPTMLGGPGKKVYIDEMQALNLVGEHPTIRKSAMVLGIRCDDKVLTGVIADRTRASIIPAIEKRVRPGSIVVTDGYSTYISLRQRGWKHVIINHSKAFHNFKGDTTSPIDIYWNVLQRLLRGYHQVKETNLWKYLGQSEFKFNTRSEKVSHFDTMISAFPEYSPRTQLAIERRYDWRHDARDLAT